MENVLKSLLKEKKEQELIKLNAVEIVDSLFNDLQEREVDILSRRFALGDHGNHQTLEEIGRLHKLTRERVRQIERASLKKIKKIDNFDKNIDSIRSLVSGLLDEHGGIMEKNFLLDILTVIAFNIDGDKINLNKDTYKKYLDFLLSEFLDDHIDKIDKSKNFNTFFKLKSEAVEYLDDLIEDLGSKLEIIKNTMHFEDLVNVFKSLPSFSNYKNKLLKNNNINLKDIFKDDVFPEWADIIDKNKVLYSIMQAVKNINPNKFGFWGSDDWAEIKPKRIADKIYLVLKEENKPMHFSEISKRINEVGFDHKKVSSGSVHNELILDDRYILVDRGVYGLKAWQN